MHVRLLCVVALALALQACGPSKGEILDMRKRAHDLAAEDARDDLAAHSYREMFGCARNCAALDAGYRWAARRWIDDPADCAGKTRAFNAGCRAYALEIERRARAAADRVAKLAPADAGLYAD